MSKFGGLGIEVDTPARMTLTHPFTGMPLVDKEGKEAYIEFYSDDSAKGRAFENAQIDRRLKQGMKSVNAEVLYAEMTEKLTKLAAGWYLVGLDGTPIDVPFTEQNAREFFADPTLVKVREAAAGFVADAANFIKA